MILINCLTEFYGDALTFPLEAQLPESFCTTCFMRSLCHAELIMQLPDEKRTKCDGFNKDKCFYLDCSCENSSKRRKVHSYFGFLVFSNCLGVSCEVETSICPMCIYSHWQNEMVWFESDSLLGTCSGIQANKTGQKILWVFVAKTELENQGHR